MSQLHILNRQSVTAPQRKQDVRPGWFSYQRCYESLVFRDFAQAWDMRVFLDNGTVAEHHVSLTNGVEVDEIRGGSDAASLLIMLRYAMAQDWADDDIIYLVEDDYLHHPAWEAILREGIRLNPNGYVSLYDHPDKYMPMYRGLQSLILRSANAHWRTTPSCCNTYAMTVKTLREDFDIHEYYCLPEHTHDGYDHSKFLQLGAGGKQLISCIPGFSTHCENHFLSPGVNWGTIKSS